MTGEPGLDDLLDEPALPSYEVFARFPTTAPDDATAVATVRGRLQSEREMYEDVRVERREADGTWMVLARFVVATVDAQAAVAGVHAELTTAGLVPDEVWAGAQY